MGGIRRSVDGGLTFAVVHMLMAPHPSWVWLSGIVVVVVTAFIAVRSASSGELITK